MTQATNLCFFRFAWNDPNHSQRQVQRVTFQLPAVPFAQLEEFPLNPEVQQQFARLMAARAKEEAVRSLDRGDFAAAGASLQAARAQMMAAPASEMMAMELNALTCLDADLASKDVKRVRKRATYQNYQARRGESFCVKKGPMMLAAVETVTEADPIWESQRHNSDVAAKTTTRESVHAASPLRSSGRNVYNEPRRACMKDAPAFSAVGFTASRK